MNNIDVKDIYAETGRMIGLVGNFRNKILAYYFLALSGLVTGFWYSYTQGNEKMREISWILPLLGTFASIVFWLLEDHERAKVGECAKVAAAIERESGIDKQKLPYNAIFDMKRKHKIRRKITPIIYLLIALLFLIWAIWAYRSLY